jgi:hypothetical protein
MSLSLISYPYNTEKLIRATITLHQFHKTHIKTGTK